MGKSWKRFRIRGIGSNLPVEMAAPIVEAIPVIKEVEIVAPVVAPIIPKTTVEAPVAKTVEVMPTSNIAKKVSSDASKTN